MDQPGELAVVVFEQSDGEWRPTQVFTRRWITFHDGREGWTFDLFDGDWCRRDQQLHLYKSGGGPPYVGGYVEPEKMPGRLWLAPGQAVRGTNGDNELSLSDLEAMGYTVVSEHPGDIFCDASDEPVTYCEKCMDYLPRYDDPCEHLRCCWHCQANFTATSPESRCPDCNESQHECEECEEPGAERCVACGRPICKGCWEGHDDSEGEPCEAPEGNEIRMVPSSWRAAQREARRRRNRRRKRRGW